MKTKTVVLAVGLPGAGKTTCSDRIVVRDNIKANALHVEDFLQANNEHVIDRYGNESLRSDSWDVVWRHVKDLLCQYRSALIIDMWLWDAERRSEVIAVLRQMGVERIVCWHFVTPAEVCRSRYIKRQSKKRHLDSYWSDIWSSFSKMFCPVGLEETVRPDDLADSRLDRFDEVVEIDTA